MSDAAALSALLLLLACGAVMGTLACTRRGSPWSRGLWSGLALAPALGCGLASVTLFTWRLARDASPGLHQVLVVAGLVILLLAVLRGARGPALDCGLRRAPSWPRKALVLVLGLVLLDGVLFVWSCRDAPDGGWDGVAVWNTLARTLARVEGDPAPVLRGLVLGAPGYPQNHPGSLALLFRLSGSESAVITGGLALCWFLGLLGLVGRAALALGSTRSSLAAVALVAATPGLVVYGAAQYADVPLACLLTAGGLALASRLQDDSSDRLPAWLAGALLGLAAWTKQEGQVQAALLLLTWVPFMWRRSERPVKELAALLLGAAPPVLALVSFKILQAPPDFLFAQDAGPWTERLLSAERWWVTTSALATAFGGPDSWLSAARPEPSRATACFGLLWPALGGLLLAGRWRTLRRRPGLAWLGLAMLAGIVAVACIFVLVPTRQEWRLRASLSRLLLQLTPLLCVFACALLEPRGISDPLPRAAGTSAPG